MGYLVALWSPPPDRTAEDLERLFDRLPPGDVPDASAIGMFVATLRAVYPSLAGRPINTQDVYLDDAAPFDLRAAGPFAVVSISWDSLSRVMPSVASAAAASGLRMYLGYSREFLEPGDADAWGPTWREIEQRETTETDALFDAIHSDELHARRQE